MKQQILLVLACLMCALSGWAQEVVIDKIHYSLYDYNGNTEAYVCGSDEDIVEANILANVTIEGVEYAVTRIFERAFSGTYNLTSVVIPEGVRGLCEWHIFDGSSLAEISIPSTCVYINQDMNIFPRTLKRVTISESNPIYYTENNCIIDKENKMLIFMPNTEEFPSGIKVLGSLFIRGTFSELTIPNGVTTILGGAFNGASIGTLNIPSSVTNIERDAVIHGTSRINVDSNNPVYYDVDGLCIIEKARKMLIGILPTATEIPEEVEMLGDYSLYYANNIISWNKQYPYSPKYAPSGQKTLCVPAGSIPRYMYSGWCRIEDVALIGAITDGTSTFYLRTDDCPGFVPRFDIVSAKAGDEIELSVLLHADAPVIGFQFDLYLPDGITVTTDEDGFEDIYLSTARTTTRKHRITSQQQADGSWRILCYSGSNSTFEGNDGEVCTINLKIDDNLPENSYPIVFRNIATSYQGGDGNTYQSEWEQFKSFISLWPDPEPYAKKLGSGDATGDGSVNVTDITSIVSYIMGNNPSIFDFWQADVDLNEKIQVGDITGTVAIIMNGSTAPNGLRPRSTRRHASGEEANPTLEIIPFAIAPGEEKEIEVMLNNPNDSFCGLQFDVTLPEGIELMSDEIGYFVDLGSRTSTRKHTIEAKQQTNGSIRVLAYSNKNYTFSGEEGDVVILTVKAADNLSAGVYNLSMKNIVLSRPDVTQTELTDYEGSILSGALADNPVIKGDITAEAASTIASAVTGSVTHIDLTQAVKVAQDAEFTTANPNTLILTPASTQNTNKNVIAGDVCANLVLSDASAFASPKVFTASQVSFTTNVNTYKTLTLPFDASLPAGFTALNAATVSETSVILQGTSSINANSPVVIKGTGSLEVTASNATVSATNNANLVDGVLCGTYKDITAPVGSYVLQKHNGVIGFYLVEGLQPTIDAFRAYMNLSGNNIKVYNLSIDDDATGISLNPIEEEEAIYYNVAGQRMSKIQKGINIQRGKKVLY